MLKHAKLSAILLLSILPCQTKVHASAPATAPVAESPDVKEIRDTLVQWSTNCSTFSEADFRKLYHTANPREATHTDFEARQDWEQAKAQQLVRDKWGPDAEAKFAHIYGTDTIEDDQTAQITIAGDHASIIWKVPAIEKTAMIKVNGKWLMDMHATFDRDLSEDPEPEKDGAQMEALLQQTAADIKAKKLARPGPFLADFQKKFELLMDDDGD